MGVSERVKEAPAQALRAMFAGIGQLLSASDKLRGKSATAEAPAEAKTAAPETVTPETVTPETVTPETVTPETATPETVAPETVTPETVTPETVTPETVTPETVTPETVTPETAAPETVAPETVPPETVTPETSGGGHVKVVSGDAAPEAPATAAPTGALPLPNYDDLTIASLRARLRNLSAHQLAQLVDYEKSHANRADVIQMFERRIAKLAEG
jgi:outer membrane biosynthesis protein TonB